MKAKIDKTQFFHKMNYDLKGHSRSHKMTLLSKWMLLFWKKLIFHKEKYDHKGQERSYKTRLAKFFLVKFIYQPILIKIASNTNIMKKLIFLKMKFDFRSHRTTFMLWLGCLAFFFQIFWSYDNLYLRSYRQLLTLFIIWFKWWY